MPFMECPTCAEKLGSPLLCQACLNNRNEIGRLTWAIKQMREDFRRIEMMAGQHCPTEISEAKATGDPQ